MFYSVCVVSIRYFPNAISYRVGLKSYFHTHTSISLFYTLWQVIFHKSQFDKFPHEISDTFNYSSWFLQSCDLDGAERSSTL